MILFFFETTFDLILKRQIKIWLRTFAKQENKIIKDVNIVFYDDEQLWTLNKQYLDHDTFTDVITFDNSKKKILNGDICISVERVKENSKIFNTTFDEELRRVIVHGVLHLCGYKDEGYDEKQLMKQKEDEALTLFIHLYN